METTPLLVYEGTDEEAAQVLEDSLDYPLPVTAKELPAAEQPSPETPTESAAGFPHEPLTISVLRPEHDEPFRVLAGMPVITEPIKMDHPGAQEITHVVSAPWATSRSFAEQPEQSKCRSAWEFELSKPSEFDYNIQRLHTKKVIKMSIVLRDGELVVTSNTSNAQEHGKEDNPGELVLEYVACEEQVLEGITALNATESEGAGPSSSYQGLASHTTLASAAVEDCAPNPGKEKGEENPAESFRREAD